MTTIFFPEEEIDERDEAGLAAEQLQEELKRQQPGWKHFLEFGEGLPAVVSERV